MTIVFEERPSDSPYVESVIHGWTVGEGSTIRPAETHWHLVFSRHDGEMFPIFVAPLTSSGVVSYGGEAELLWIKFRMGTFMPHLPARSFLNAETALPTASSRSFWLKGAAVPFPTFDNVENFVNRLVREDVLTRDPVVEDVLQEKSLVIPSRTVRHRFLRATGLTQTHIRQVERAQYAADLLRRGYSILDTVFEAGYFDQPHLTRSLKQWVGFTPAQILRQVRSQCRSAESVSAQADETDYAEAEHLA